MTSSASSTAASKPSTPLATTSSSWAGCTTSTSPTRATLSSSSAAVTAASMPETRRTPDNMATVTESDAIAGVVIVEPDSHGDERGRFVESYRRSWFPHGREMVQGNRSDKQAGALVGLHFHLHQADYWYVPRGRALVVLHDLREGSPTEGATLTLEMGEGHEVGVCIPPGVAHGLAALTAPTTTYLVD